MGDEHLNTIPATESDEFIKSCVENLVPNPSESEGENGCDVPACFTTFSNIFFDAEYESDSSDYQSCYDEDFPKEIFSNPLFEEEINSMRIYQHHFNAESDLIESLLNRDSSIISSSSKIDSLLDEFADIRLIERLLYDNSSPRPPKEFVSENSNANIESFSPSPIPVEHSDYFMEEIDLSFNPDDPLPPSIEDDDDDSERDILIHEELPSSYSLSLPVNELFYFDIPLFSRPPAKPPDVVQYSRKCEDSYQRILSSKSLFPQLQLGINLLHLAGSQPMLNSSYKVEDGVIISIPPLIGGVKDKQEKDKIETKPDKNGKRGKAQRSQKSVTVKKAGKEKKIQVQGTKPGKS
nr:hypothetical protein [Tanacetum cinerariifolium]